MDRRIDYRQSVSVMLCGPTEPLFSQFIHTATYYSGSIVNSESEQTDHCHQPERTEFPDVILRFTQSLRSRERLDVLDLKQCSRTNR